MNIKLRRGLLIFYLCYLFQSCATGNKSEKNQDIKLTKTEPERDLSLSYNEVINSKFPIQDIFGTWTRDSVNIDFRLDSLSFFIIARNTHLPYLIRHDTIVVFETFNDTVTGILKKVTKDSLIVFWHETNEYDRYIRWKPQ